MFAGEKVAGRRNEWTKNCKNEKLTIRKNPKQKKMSGQKNVKTKKYTTKKTRHEKSRNERMRNENLRTKKSPTKIGRTKIGPDTKCVLDIFLLVRIRNYAFSNTLLKIIAIPKFQLFISIRNDADTAVESWLSFFGSVRILAKRVNCPCPEQGRNPNSQLSSAISPSILPIEPQDHNQLIHRNPVNGLVMIFRFSW